MEKERIASFDLAKGLLMFLVVYGHAIHELMREGSLFDQGMVFAIYSFHMPLFIFVSGCFAWNKCHGCLKSVIVKNVKRMVIPGLICAIAWYFQMHYNEPIIHGYYNSTRNVWFVFGLFAIFLVCNLAYKTKHPLVWMSAFVILFYVTCDYQPIDLLKHFKIAVFLPYFVVGLYIKRLLTPPYLTYVYIIGALSTIVLAEFAIFAPHYCYIEFFKSTQWWFQYLFYPIGFCAAFSIFVFIHQHIEHHWFVKMVCKFGEATLGVYFIHPFLIGFINAAFGKMNSITIVLISLIVSVISYLLVVILRKFKLTKRLLLGEYK